MGAVMVASAFINNTAVVVMLSPVAISLAGQFSQAPSRILIPLSYASILGGTCTLIGTSTNLLVDGIGTEHGLAPFSVFELTAPGAILGATGLVYLLLFGRRLLPDRESAASLVEKEGRKRFLSELVITSESDLIDKTLASLGASDTEIVEVVRDAAVLPRPAEVTLRQGDRVVVRAPAGEAVHLRAVAKGAESDGDDQLLREQLLPAGFALERTTETLIREGIVRPGSHYEGSRVGSLNLRRLFDVRILAVHRQGGTMRRDFEKVRLQVGDALLLEGPPAGLNRLFDTGELVSLGEPALQRVKTEKAPIVLAILGCFVVLAAAGVVPIAAGALTAATALLATGCLRPSDAYEAVDWRILFTIFGMLAIGRALETSGAMDFIVAALLDIVSDMPPWLVLCALYLTASVLTELVTNNAVAIVMTPIAIGLAAQLGLDPRPLVVAVMFAGSASFATPLGYQTNTFVYGAGNYRFVDFVRIGAPLNILSWLVATLVIPWFWPLSPG